MFFIARRSLAVALFAIAGTAFAEAPSGSPTSTAPAAAELLSDHAKTCRHYENRARFKPRGPGAGLEVRAADQCRAALDILRDETLNDPARAARAGLWLDRLTILRRTIISINADRIYGKDRDRGSKPKAPAAGRYAASARTVTASGEYLIAREIGVLKAMRAWKEGELELAKAAAPSRP